MSALAGTTSTGRGTMLWFNEVKDQGALRTDDGIRIEVPGEAFSAGEKPRGRCAVPSRMTRLIHVFSLSGRSRMRRPTAREPRTTRSLVSKIASSPGDNAA